MSLGWLNLQEYLGANQGAADEMAQRLDAQRAETDAMGRTPGLEKDVMSYGRYLDRANNLEKARTDEATRAAALGGGAADAFLAAKGQGTGYQTPTFDKAGAARQRQEMADTEKAYWDAAAKRNQGRQAQADAEKKAQADRFAAAEKAMGPAWAERNNYAKYSDAVAKSFGQARDPRGVRIISQEEDDAWTR